MAMSLQRLIGEEALVPSGAGNVRILGLTAEKLVEKADKSIAELNGRRKEVLEGAARAVKREEEEPELVGEMHRSHYYRQVV